jgi:hypothetical protein
MEAFILVKGLADDGGSAWSYRTTNPMNREDLLGALTVQVELIRGKLVRSWADRTTRPGGVPPSGGDLSMQSSAAISQRA